MMSSKSSHVREQISQQPGIQVEERWERRKRWLIAFATVIVVVFLIYLFLILVYPSMNIGTNSWLRL